MTEWQRKSLTRRRKGNNLRTMPSGRPRTKWVDGRPPRPVGVAGYVNRPLRPRARAAIQLWATAGAPTQKAAAAAVGLTEASLSLSLRHSMEAQALVSDLQSAVQSKVIDLSKVIELMSGRALEVIGNLMTQADKEDVRLKAAQDVLDRNPITSKTRRIMVEPLSLAGRDISVLARALSAGKGLELEFPSAALADFIPVGNED